MSGVSLTDEYATAAEHLGFGFAELATLAVRSFAGAFLPWEQRLQLMDEAAAAARALGAEIAA